MPKHTWKTYLWSGDNLLSVLVYLKNVVNTTLVYLKNVVNTTEQENT